MKRNESQAVSDNSVKILDLDEFLPYLVNVLARRLSVDLAKVYQSRFGIGIPEWRVLAHLANHQKVSVRDIYERVSMDKVKVSRAAALLEARGHVIKNVSLEDNRLVELRLSPSGRELMRKIAPLAIAYEEKALSRLSGSEREAFLCAIRKLIADPPLEGQPLMRPVMTPTRPRRKK
jgi:DNA-binding MarR family transcriptional regulator